MTTPPPTTGQAEVIIRAENVKKLYRIGDEEVWALKGISLDVYRGEFISIMGPSGSGKSTFFNQLGALDIPTEGKVFFESESLFDLPEDMQAWVRCNQIGYIFQTYNLISVMSALQNVILPMLFQGTTKEEATTRASRILDRVGLGHRLDHKPAELSGGQQQRVSIARALANTPAVILADEPTGNLDSKTSIEVMGLFQELGRAGITVVLVTHEPDIAEFASRVIVVKDGLIQSDTRHEPRPADAAALGVADPGPPEAVASATAGGSGVTS
jgi:putative ABC transport system ATP-binding protein